ncbi:MAG TPA: hypothetical protein DER33_02775 [Syntrophomonas sp.]|jgi:purine-binding chemotaxis protein CheW|nr:hypothetical protein [Syntrophomonas sp.]HCF70508.1 hypothetical protein [Syntrophomonas sp.]
MVMKSTTEGQVSFKLGNEEFGLPADNIIEIMQVPEINQLPHTADYLLGVIKVKGVIIPIIDLKKKLTGDATNMDADCRIIIMEINYSQVGLLVESLGDNFDYESSELESPDNTESEVPSNYLLGIARSDNNLIKILDYKALLG